MRKATFSVVIGGNDISAALRPMLISMTITDNEGTHSDSASIQIDDTGGQVLLPTHGDPVRISLGWEGEGAREVFVGTVDEIRSSGTKSAGRTLTVSAKGFDTLGKAKEGQTRHFDDMTVGEILEKAGKFAGISCVSVDPELAQIRLPYIAMRGESFLHLGERIAARIGGLFRVQGDKATVARAAAGYKPSVSAASGDNLISWDITPLSARGQYKAAEARSYDVSRGEETVVEEIVEDAPPSAKAKVTFKDLAADPDDARRRAKSGGASSQEAAGGGTIIINGSTEGVPGGQCALSGARPGIDGAYKITSVTHSIGGTGGWVTSLSVSHPQSGAGKDQRRDGNTEAAGNIDSILAGDGE